MKSKLEIIEETAQSYTLKNRSVSIGTNQCVYLGDKDTRCAFSRCCMDDPDTNNILRHNQQKTAGELLRNFPEDQLLKPEYLGHDLTFWNRIQDLHDWSPNWDENGLTGIGQYAVETLRMEYPSK